MTFDDALDFYKTQTKIAETVGVTKSAVSHQKARGDIIPLRWALKINKDSAGAVDLRLNQYQE